MQSKSELFESILQSKAYSVVSKAEVDGVEYLEGSGLVQAAVYGSLFAGNGPSVGGTVSREIDIIIRNSASVSRMAKIRLFSRLELGDRVSEWIPKGVFYIDTRTVDAVTGCMTIHGYDAMLMLEQMYLEDGSSDGTWPRAMTDVVADIAQIIGVELDGRTSIPASYTVPYPAMLTMREIMGYAAACCGSNWTVTETGALRLVPLVPDPDTIHDLGEQMANLETGKELQPFTGVLFWADDLDICMAGDDSGRVLEIECPWGTQEMADAIRASITDWVYRPFEAASAILDPAAELGDAVNLNGVESVLASCEASFNALCTVDIAAPSDEEVDHEYPYPDKTKLQTKREIAKAKAEIQVGLDEITASVEGVNGDLAQLKLEVDGITLEVTSVSTSGGQTYARIRLKGGNGEWQEGQILLDGNVNVSGQLSAESLYAALGDVANLLVNRLSTSRRIPKYLAEDTSDDRYFCIVNETQCMRRAWTDGSTEQAANPDGALLYWEQDISDASLGANGYPFLDGVQVPTTTTETPYPVMVYVYEEGDRWKLTFDEANNYGPKMVWGEGDGTSSGKGRGYLEKLGLSYDIYNYASDGVKKGIFMGDDYVDVTCQRKLTNVDVTETSTGATIALTFDGGVTDKLTLTNTDTGVTITDAAGHVTAVTGVTI